MKIEYKEYAEPQCEVVKLNTEIWLCASEVQLDVEESDVLWGS